MKLGVGGLGGLGRTGFRAAVEPLSISGCDLFAKVGE